MGRYDGPPQELSPQPLPIAKQDIGGVSPPPVNQHSTPTNVDLQPPEQTPRINVDVGGPPPPPIGGVNQVVGVPWSTGLFDCHEDENNAIVTALFPCITFGQIAEILDAGQTSCALGSLMYLLMAPALCTCGVISSKYRTKLRSKYNLVEDQGEDWIVHLFCSYCALCQEYRELSKRGIDPSLGWMGILAQQQQQNVATTPPPPQAMYK